ncbi:Hypothetical predicted protein [Octopus vulgaris]|uniref:Uncharacterized protein n=1 Tax=Octopus vulgaris TaxID=6645 RepID=A0AA36APC7_OCTVU|nr:Hypothetical predicted protein [Octopus vulgaris]
MPTKSIDSTIRQPGTVKLGGHEDVEGPQCNRSSGDGTDGDTQNIVIGDSDIINSMTGDSLNLATDCKIFRILITGFLEEKKQLLEAVL